MKTYNKFMLSILGSAIVVGSVSAQTWTLNGTTQPLQLTTSSNESAVAIDPLTGVASVKTAGVGPSVSVSANPGSVNVNVATTVTWSTSNFGNNLNCTRTSSPTLSGWNGASTLAAGSVSVTMPSSQQTVSLTLSCSGDNGSATNSTNVLVMSGTSIDCTQRPARVEYNNGFGNIVIPKSTIPRTFFSMFNANFPGPIGGFSTGAVGDGIVLAFEFDAPSAPVSGNLKAVTIPGGGGSGVIVTSVSECPGEMLEYVFGNTTQANNCWGGQTKTELRWNVTAADPVACQLVPGKRYYFNVSMREGCLTDSGAGGASCRFNVETR